MTAMLSAFAQYAPTILAAVVAGLAVIAPVTQSDLDNKVLDVLRFIEDKVLSLIFPSLKNPPLPTDAAPNTFAK